MHMYYRLILYLKYSNWIILHVLILELIGQHIQINVGFIMQCIDMVCFKMKIKMKSRKKSSVIENKGVFNFSVKKENEAKLLICHYNFPRRPILDFSTRTSTIVYRHQPRPLLSQSEESALLAGFLKATMTWTLSPNSTTPVCGNRTCHPRTCKCHGEWKTAYYNHKQGVIA